MLRGHYQEAGSRFETAMALPRTRSRKREWKASWANWRSSKETTRQLVETLPGVSRSFTVERSYEPSIAMTGSAMASAELKAKVEATLGVTLGKRAAVKESITLDGKEITKLNVQWVERYRRATATTSDGSTVMFLVKVGLRFKLEKAK